MKWIKEWDYIFLKWIDSSWWAWWIDKDDVPWISTIESVWIVFKLTKEYITIIQSQCTVHDQIDNYINIPIVAITEFNKLKTR